MDKEKRERAVQDGIETANKQRISQRELARLTGINRVTVNNLALGRGGSLSTLRKMEDWLKANGFYPSAQKIEADARAGYSVSDNLASELHAMANIVSDTRIPAQLRARRWQSFIQDYAGRLDDMAKVIGSGIDSVQLD